MSDALEQAAQAFDTAMGNSQPAAREPSTNNGPVESLFGDNLGVLEVDDESPAKGGGDDDLPSRVKPQVRKEVELQQEEEFDAEVDPDADSEADPDAEVDPDADPEADPDKEDGEDDIYEVVVDGERVEVGLQEALNGYIRQETFHRRLNQLSEAKQAIVAEAQEVISARQKYTGLIEDMQKHIDLLIPKEPDWDEEYARDPKAARELQKRYEQLKETRALLDQEKTRVSKEQQEADERNKSEYIATENAKIMRNNPSWKDEKVRMRDLTMMMETGTRAGFTPEEIREVYDSRMVQILLKAARYDRLQASKPKPVRRGTTPTKPGAGSTRTAPKGSQAMSRLSKTGSVEDAANVFANIINPPRRR